MTNWSLNTEQHQEFSKQFYVQERLMEAEGRKDVLLFHGNCFSAIKTQTHKRHTEKQQHKPSWDEEMHLNITCNPAQITRKNLIIYRGINSNWHESRGNVRRKHEWTDAPLFLCKVPSAWQRKVKKWSKENGNGNSTNGYHKVKCQVPEIEELQEREKGQNIGFMHTKVTSMYHLLGHKCKSCIEEKTHYHINTKLLITTQYLFFNDNKRWKKQ